jgi:hypothetical protein
MKHFSKLLRACALFAIVAITACGPSHFGGDTGSDASPDRVITDASPDRTVPDARVDARVDAPMDTIQSDVPQDVATDVPADAPTDVSTDVSMGMGNAVCAMATPLMNGMTLMQDASLGVDSLATRCRMPASGKVLYYRLTLAPGQYARVTVTPMGWDAVIRVLSSCSAATCTFADDAVVGGAETVTVQNTTTASADYIVAVGSFSPTETGMFSINTVIASAPGNATCAAATAVSASTTLMAQSVVGGSPTLNTACTYHGSTTSPGEAVYYSVTVPAQSLLQANATLMGFDAVMQILPSCGATTCLTSHDMTGMATEGITYFNNTTSPVTVILVVGSQDGSRLGTFDLTITIGPSPYIESTTPTACDDMTGSTSLNVRSDDVASTIQMLPFTFRYFSADQTYFSATSNGFAQLYPTSTGSTSSSLGNVAIPDSGTPNNFIAAFWDDLYPGTGGDIVTKVFGTAGSRHFTLQWSSWLLYADRTQGLTFQIKLFEATNVIEIHYCTITGTTAAVTGGSATIGIENSIGSFGIQHSYNMGSSISMANAIRYAPAP